MAHTARKKVRRLIIVALAGIFVCSTMYVSFAFGFRAGI
jgi:hypothetical protein